MVSLAPDREMELEPPTEEPKKSPIVPEDPDEPEAFSGPVDTDDPAEAEGADEPGPGPGEEPRREEVVEMVCQRDDGEGHTLENDSDSGNLRVGAQADGKELRKTNSWKTVRFQDPSNTDAVLERDSSGESLFPDYGMEEWTLSYFEELFVAEDWQNITGRNRLYKIQGVDSGWCNTCCRPTFLLLAYILQ